MNRMTKTRTLVFSLVLVTGLASAWIAGAQPPDPVRVERQLEIMTGILETTMRFASEEHAAQSGSKTLWDGALPAFGKGYFTSESVRGYHLPDQGVVFLIRTPGPGAWGLAGPESAYRSLILEPGENDLEDMQQRVEKMRVDLEERRELREAKLEVQAEQIQAQIHHGIPPRRDSSSKKNATQSLVRQGQLEIVRPEVSGFGMLHADNRSGVRRSHEATTRPSGTGRSGS